MEREKRRERERVRIECECERESCLKVVVQISFLDIIFAEEICVGMYLTGFLSSIFIPSWHGHQIAYHDIFRDQPQI